MNSDRRVDRRADPLQRPASNMALAQRKRVRAENLQYYNQKRNELFVYKPDPGDEGALGDGKTPKAFVEPFSQPAIVAQRLKPNQDKLLRIAMLASGMLTADPRSRKRILR